MVNVGRVCNNDQEEGVLRTDAHMSFIKTTGLRAFEVVHLLIFTGQFQKCLDCDQS